MNTASAIWLTFCHVRFYYACRIILSGTDLTIKMCFSQWRGSGSGTFFQRIPILPVTTDMLILYIYIYIFIFYAYQIYKYFFFISNQDWSRIRGKHFLILTTAKIQLQLHAFWWPMLIAAWFQYRCDHRPIHD